MANPFTTSFSLAHSEQRTKSSQKSSNCTHYPFPPILRATPLFLGVAKLLPNPKTNQEPNIEERKRTCTRNRPTNQNKCPAALRPVCICSSVHPMQLHSTDVLHLITWSNGWRQKEYVAALHNKYFSSISIIQSD